MELECKLVVRSSCMPAQESVQEKSFAKRAEEERKAHPHFRHLDQLLK
ncbi:hypothetical protein [Blautia sp. MSJ-9]|nr:hypothetical protein [Blautia sp. MSJ-9]MBU5681905.1 hypothetical protein [Blautia sp. MSJ-9]